MSAGTDITTPPATGDIDSLTWGFSSEPVSLDWTLAYNENYNELTVLTNESLTQITPELGFAPSLATSWSNPDPLRWVFQLRKGVKFHDGSIMTAEDVAFSLSRNLSPNSFWAEWNTFMKRVEVSGANEVTVHLTKPDYLFIEMMCTPLGGVGKASQVKALGKNFGTPGGLPIGTGPFKAVKWTTGQAYTLERFDGYWDTAHVAKAKTLTAKFVLDSNAMADALLGGSIDGAYVPNLLQALPRLRASTTGKIYLGKSMREVYIFPTEKPGPLQDPRVRLAWLSAIDRPAIAESIFHSGAAPLRDTIVPLDNWAALGPAAVQMATAAYKQLAGPAPDLAKAKALFKEAGSPAGEVLVFVANSPTAQNTAAVCAAGAKQIGLNVKLASGTEAQELNLFFDKKARDQYHAFFSFDYWSSVADPTEIMWEVSTAPTTNAIGYSWVSHDPQNDALLLKARQTRDLTQRAKILLQVQQLQATLVPEIPIVSQANPLYMNNRITGAPASFSQLFYPWARDVGAA